jgi:hypothetical protein
MNLRFPAGVSALLLLLAIPAAAQETYREDPLDSLRDRLGTQYDAGIAALAVKYWEPRLNAYKTRFDGIFGVQDLQGLDELRARFSMLIAEERRKEEEMRERARTAAAIATSDTSYAVPDDVEAEVATDATADTVAEVAVNSESELAPEEIARRAKEYRLEREQGKEREMDAQEARLAQGSKLVEESWYGAYSEILELPAVSKWLAHRYRTSLDHVGEMVFTDLRAFVDEVAAYGAEFQRVHAVEIAQVPDMRERLESRSDMDDFARLLRHPLYLRHEYISMIEPMLLLYDGEGLDKLVGSVMRSSSVEGMPEVSLASQNTPNPAAETTSITITLPEASTQTTFRLLNTQGEVVMTLDKGALAAGSHAVAVDVSSLPSGSYLYQVRAHLSSGEKVTGRIMQVMR